MSDSPIMQGDFSPLTKIAEVNPPLPKRISDDCLVSFITMSDVKEEGGLHEFDDKLFKEVKSGFTRFIDNDVIFAKITPCMENGKGALAKGLTSGLACGSTEFHVLRASAHGCPEYIYQITKDDSFRQKAEMNMTGSAGQRRVPSDFFSKHEAYIPAKSQQQKIAKILSTVDNLIENTQTLIDKYSAIKQGMMADLFTRGIDLSPGPDGTPASNPNYGKLRPSVEEAPELYKETELGWVPREWEVNTIEEVSKGGFKNGYFKDPKLLGVGMKLVNVSELYQDFGIDISPEKVERIRVSSKDYEKYKVEVGDIFFTRSSLVLEGIAKSNIMRCLPEEAVFECHVMRLKPNQDLMVPEFLALYTGIPKARSYLMSMAKQVTMTTIAQPDMIGLPVPVPNLKEQSKIIKQLDSIEKLIRKESAEMNKNKEIKKGLMQDLLTGKVRVN